jgi:hypothetical protein
MDDIQFKKIELTNNYSGIYKNKWGINVTVNGLK